jgi:hypothetical protein
VSGWLVGLVPVVLLGAVFLLGFTGCPLVRAGPGPPIGILRYDRSIASVSAVTFTLNRGAPGPEITNVVRITAAGVVSRLDADAPLASYRGNFSTSDASADNTFTLELRSATADPWPARGTWSVNCAVTVAGPGPQVSNAPGDEFTFDIPPFPHDAPLNHVFRFRPAAAGEFEVVPETEF